MTRSNAEWLRLIATWLPAYSFQLNEAANELDGRSPMSGNRKVRIAELEREIEHIKAMSWSVPSDKRSERFMAISYELAHLRNEVTSAALAQSDAEPATRLDIDAAVKAGLATRNPAPDAAPSSYSNTKTVTIGPAALAQSDAEPVILYRYKSDPSDVWRSCSEGSLKYCQDNPDKFDWRILYTAPPRPDASGLIEAAEIAEEWDSGWGEDRNTKVARQTAIEIAAAIRSRAADRSGK